MKPVVDFPHFAALDLRVGEIKEASEVPGSDKLLQLKVFLGDEIGERTIYAGIKAWYAPEKVVGRRVAFVVNLAPKTFKIGSEEYTSEGMLMASGENEAVLYTFDKDVPPGSIVR